MTPDRPDTPRHPHDRPEPAERPIQTIQLPPQRIRLDDLTSDQYDQLCDELDALRRQRDDAEAAIERFRAVVTEMRDWDGDRPGFDRWVEQLTAALDATG